MQQIKTSSIRTLVVISVLAFILTAATAATAQPYAEIGRIQADGTISYHSWKFRAEIPNEFIVHDVYTEMSDGFAWVVLADPEGCKGARLLLWTADGPLVDFTEDPSGWDVDVPVIVRELPEINPIFFSCEDNGCAAIADEPWEEWRCVKPSGSACDCLVITSGDIYTLWGEEYCKSAFRLPEFWKLEDFLRPSFIID